MRIGHGYDAHQIISGSGMVLGGVEIKCDYSIEAHSDGDIIVHSLIDALLGAAAYGDLGTFFPSSDENLKGISSFSMLSTVLEKLSHDNYTINNIDITYVGQVPKLLQYREEIIKNLSKAIDFIIKHNIRKKILHYCDGNRISPYEFILKIINISNIKKYKIRKVKYRNLKLLATRPKDSYLGISKELKNVKSFSFEEQIKSYVK